MLVRRLPPNRSPNPPIAVELLHSSYYFPPSLLPFLWPDNAPSVAEQDKVLCSLLGKKKGRWCQQSPPRWGIAFSDVASPSLLLLPPSPPPECRDIFFVKLYCMYNCTSGVLQSARCGIARRNKKKKGASVKNGHFERVRVEVERLAGAGWLALGPKIAPGTGPPSSSPLANRQPNAPQGQKEEERGREYLPLLPFSPSPFSLYKDKVNIDGADTGWK